MDPKGPLICHILVRYIEAIQRKMLGQVLIYVHSNPTNIGIAMGTLTLGGDTSGSLAMGGVNSWG